MPSNITDDPRDRVNVFVGALYERRKAVVALWAPLLLVLLVLAVSLKSHLRAGGYSVPGTDYHTASAILEQEFDASPYSTMLLVFHSDDKVVSDKAYAQAVLKSVHALAHEPLVRRIDTVYSTGVPDLVTEDNHTTYALARLHGTEEELERAAERIRTLTRSDELDVYVSGQPSVNHDLDFLSAEDLIRIDAIAAPLGYALLVAFLGSFVGAMVPVGAGMISVLCCMGLLSVLARLMDLSIFAMNVAFMVSFALTVDFCLIIMSRFQDELRRTGVKHAIQIAFVTAGRAVALSAFTLISTMSVMVLYPVMILQSIGLAVIVSTFVSALTCLLLMPSILGLLGARVQRNPKVERFSPFKLSEASATRLARWVMRRPGIMTALSLIALAALAYPARDMVRVGTNVKTLPASAPSRRAVDVLEQYFGAGEAAPIMVVIQADAAGGLWSGTTISGLYQLHQALNQDRRVQRVRSLMSMVPNPSLDWARTLGPATLNTNADRRWLASQFTNLGRGDDTTMMLVYPRKGDTHPDTSALLADIRAHHGDWAPDLRDSHLYVGGPSALYADFDWLLYNQVPLLTGVSLVTMFVSLLIFFRSLFVPLKAIVLNLASLFASYGVVVLVFQRGLLHAIGLESLGGVQIYTPILLFTLLFGISTDYEVFLLSRIRENHAAGMSNEDSVAVGVGQTARVITSAGLIMAIVFGAGCFSGIHLIKEMAFGTSVAIFLDLTLVRLILVPATMKLMENYNWWMPKPLLRLLPAFGAPRPFEPAQESPRPSGSAVPTGEIV